MQGRLESRAALTSKTDPRIQSECSLRLDLMKDRLGKLSMGVGKVLAIEV